MAFELFMKVTDIYGLINFSLLLIVNNKHDVHKAGIFIQLILCLDSSLAVCLPTHMLVFDVFDVFLFLFFIFYFCMNFVKEE